jgi:hypothetical protein
MDLSALVIETSTCPINPTKTTIVCNMIFFVLSPVLNLKELDIWFFVIPAGA